MLKINLVATMNANLAQIIAGKNSIGYLSVAHAIRQKAARGLVDKNF